MTLNPVAYMRFVGNVWKGNSCSPSREKLGFVTQLLNVRRYLRLNGLEPNEYYLYDLCRAGISNAERDRYISRNQIYLINRSINPQFDQGVAANKLLLRQMLVPYGLPFPRLFGVLSAIGGKTADGQTLRTLDDFTRFLTTVVGKELFFKPVSANLGRGIRLVRVVGPDQLESAGEGELSAEALYRSMMLSHHSNRDFVIDIYTIEEKLRQHRWLDRYTPDCAQTMRVVTYINQSGEIEILMSLLKVGVSGKFVDNVGTTGMAAPVDASGRLGSAGQPRNGVVARFDKHPESGAAIAGEIVPYHKEVVETARKAHSLIPQLRSLGWDIAITDDGPVILEANTYWSHLLQFVADRGAATPALSAELRQLAT